MFGGIENLSSFIDASLIESCYFIFVTPSELGLPLEIEFVNILKSLSNAVGKKFVHIITEDGINEKRKVKGKAGGGGKGTKVSVILTSNEQEQIVYLIKEAVIQYTLSLVGSNTSHKSSDKTASVKTMHKKAAPSKALKLKIELKNCEDDRPRGAPKLFVVLVGFTNPNVVRLDREYRREYTFPWPNCISTSVAEWSKDPFPLPARSKRSCTASL
ncbi:hypothetical protein WDU94_002681 [Cyamophila willieti]